MSQAKRLIATLLAAASCSWVADARADDDDRVRYDEGLIIDSADERYRVKLRGRAQGLHEVRLREDEREGALMLRRGRAGASGHVASPRLRYKIQLSFDERELGLKDAMVTAEVVEDWLALTMGQYKKPFSRQQLASTTELALVDRTILDEAFGAGRDLGLMARAPGDQPMTYALGIFDGRGEGLASPGEPLAVGRVGWQTDGMDTFGEVDRAGGPLRLGVSLAAQSRLFADPEDDRDLDVGLDYILKGHRLTAHGGLYAAWDRADSALRWASVGGYAELGYLLLQRLQPTLRYAQILGAEGLTRTEVRGGLTFLVIGHQVKGTVDAGELRRRSPDGAEDELVVRSMLLVRL